MHQFYPFIWCNTKTLDEKISTQLRLFDDILFYFFMYLLNALLASNRTTNDRQAKCRKWRKSELSERSEWASVSFQQKPFNSNNYEIESIHGYENKRINPYRMIKTEMLSRSDESAIGSGDNSCHGIFDLFQLNRTTQNGLLPMMKEAHELCMRLCVCVWLCVILRTSVYECYCTSSIVWFHQNKLVLFVSQVAKIFYYSNTVLLFVNHHLKADPTLPKPVEYKPTDGVVH